MDKACYIAFIKYFENNETRKIIGKIDINLLYDEKIECLYYAFPLIEKIILEIFKLVPEADVECFGQGIMRTPISIIENNDGYKILPSFIIDLIEKYYSNNGPRNQLFHSKEEEIKLKVDFKELIYLIAKLIMIFRNKLDEVNDFEFEDIKLLE